MRKTLLSRAAMALAAMTVSASAVAGSFSLPLDRIKEVPQLRKLNAGAFDKQTPGRSYDRQADAARAAVADKVLPGADALTYMLAPDGTIWYATLNFDYTAEVLPGGYTQNVISGYEVTVYNNQFKEMGTIKDVCAPAENETRIASVQVDLTLTKKFFNFDDKYEVVVTIFANTPDYTVNSRSLIYSLGGAVDENGNSAKVAEMPGYIVDSDNYAIDRFSENYLITFMEEVNPSMDDYDDINEYLEDCKIKLTTMTKAGYSGGPKAVLETEVGQLYLPGDGMTAPFFFSTVTADNKPAFVVSRYEKSYWANPLDPTDDAPTPDNHLLIDVYTMTSVTASAANKAYSTSIDMELPTSGNLARFYGIGSFAYTDDANFTDYTTDGKPAFIITVGDVPAADPDNTIPSFYVYNTDGEKLLTIGESVESYSLLSSAEGLDDEALFIKYDNNTGYTFNVVNIINGQTVLALEPVIDGNVLTTAFDRAVVGGKTYYVSSLSNHIEDGEGVTYELVAWIDTDGNLERIDQLNLGTDIALAQVNINSSVLNPYLFDTDADMEYMVLVKRTKAEGSSAADEVLLIADAKSAPIFEAGPMDEYGILANLSVVNIETTPTLYVLYGTSQGVYTQHLYNLPLTKFAGGEGTADNPYLVATIADLQQMKSNTTACYKVVNDIDAAGFNFVPVESFGGSLDGDNHVISNFSTAEASYQGMLANTVIGASVKNIVFDAPVLKLSSRPTAAGLVVGNGMGVSLNNIHVYSLKASGEEFDGTFGSIAGMLTNNSTVSACFVAGAGIDLPEGSVGGIAGELRTSSAVASSAFSGTINAGANTGGIVANGGTGFSVADCHVDADIIATNTVGGIVGSAERGSVNRNVVEGTLAATTPGRWTSLNAGGVVGMLTPDYTEYEEGTAAPKVVTNNIVALSMMTVGETSSESWVGQHDTAHRIVGGTIVNQEPEPIGYDEDTWEPIYSTDPIAPDAGLENNYVLGALAPMQEAIADDHSTTEGKTLDADEFGRDFLENLGYVYGTTAEEPWSELALSTPYLHFEQKIFLSQTDYAVKVGETFYVDIKILSRGEIDPEELMGDFLCDYNEQVLEMSDMALEGNVLSLGFTCLKDGTSSISISMLGSSVQAMVYGTSGVNEVSVATEANSLSFDGSVVSCEGAAIAIYNLAGVQVAAGYDAVSVSALAQGVYVVSAVSADGKSVAKIAVK